MPEVYHIKLWHSQITILENRIAYQKRTIESLKKQLAELKEKTKGYLEQ